MVSKQQQAKVYWERQGNNRLCGLHCVNSLLQGPYFDEISLATIGQELDKKEQELTGAQFAANNNVDDKGSYSLQAIKRTMGLILESVDQDVNRKLDMTSENAFICNSIDHWFTIRKIGKTFYDLNSLKPVPKKISDFYLSAFLQSHQQSGYSIFVVRGNFKPMHISEEDLQEHQYYFTPGQIEAIKNLEQTPDKNEDIKEEEEKVTLYEGIGAKLIDSQQMQQNKANFNQNQVDANLDPELAMVMKLSLQEKYNPTNRPKAGILFKFVNPDGKKYDWTFDPNSLVYDLYDFARFIMPENQTYQFYLSQNQPYKVHNDVNKTLKETGLTAPSILLINKN